MNGNKLKARLVEKGVTAKDLCQIIGMPVTTWQTKVSGESDFRRFEIQKIIEALDLSDDDVIEIFFANDVQ